MADTPKDTLGASPGVTESQKTPDLVGLAAQLAQKHGAQAGGSAGPSGAGPGQATIPGRPTPRRGPGGYDAAVKGWLAKRGLVAVPAGGSAPSAPDSLPAPPTADARPPYVVDPAFVQSCVKTLLQGVESFRQRQVFLKTLAISEDKNLAKSFADEAGAPPGAIEVMSLCAGEITQKYDVLAAATPEALLVVASLTWFAKDIALWRRLNQLAALKGKKPEKTEAKEAKE